MSSCQCFVLEILETCPLLSGNLAIRALKVLIKVN